MLSLLVADHAACAQHITCVARRRRRTAQCRPRTARRAQRTVQRRQPTARRHLRTAQRALRTGDAKPVQCCAATVDAGAVP